MWKPSTTPHDVLMHSAKGSTWKNHKYLKKIGNAYIYAKAASKAKKKSKEAYDMAEAHGKWTILAKRNANDVSNRRNEPPSFDAAISNGKEAKYWNDISELDRKHGATQYQNAIMYDRASKSYKNLAKQNLASIPKEISSNTKKKVSSAMKKLKNKLVTEETTVTDAYTGKKRKTNMKANYKKSKKKIRIKK